MYGVLAEMPDGKHVGDLAFHGEIQSISGYIVT
jgi:hypothetical protein